jgi:arylsulfatase A-like enzyme
MAGSRRAFLRQLTGGAVLAAAGRAAAAARRKPNIVYIMSDELGYYELSCMGHPHIRTPHVDRMAEEGVRFTQALAGCSVCAPTRCCLMTGKHMGHTSVRTNPGGTPMREGEETVASVLKRQGYATGGFGKWGCGGRGSTGVPEKHGFDVFFGYYDQVHAHTYYPPYLVRNSREVPLQGNHGRSDGETYSHYVIMKEGLEFIRANKDRPFFCYLPVTPPHGIFDIPDDDPAWALYKDKPWPEPARRYAAMVTMVDRNVGEVLGLLKELGLDRDTIVFFCGDNGGNDYFRDEDHPRGFHAPNVNPKTDVAFRGHKGNLYEGGLRIAMIVRWPGRIRPGRVSDFLWYFPDVLPTLAELAGAEAPDDVDGLSIVPELVGEDAAGRKQPAHESLYWEYGGWTAVRMGDWKAVRPRGRRGRNAPEPKWELYDLATDIEEKHDLAAKHPDVLAKMVAIAEKAHEPAREGTFHNRALHLRDKQAKFGFEKPAAAEPAHALPEDGLIPRKQYQLVRASSESKANGKRAVCAFDGDPGTWWHSKFAGKVETHPHELVIDLSKKHTVRGFRYLARQDKGWNGAVKECEFYVSDSPDDFGKPAARATLEKSKEPQEVTCEPVQGRYVRFVALSEVNGQPWASVSELGILGE